MRYSMSYWIYLIFFIGIFSKEKNKITINEIQWYSTDIYLVFFIEILSREESKIIIKFLFTILSSIYYVINTILSNMIVCKKNEIFDERLDIQYILDSTVRIVKLIFHRFILFLWRNKNIFIDLRYFSRGRHIFQDFNKFY